MSKLGIGERAPWDDFPQVIRNGDLGALKNEPEYQAAKSGDMPAAIELVDRLLTDETVENRGGEVVAASVMTAHEGALDLPVKPSMLAAIENKHWPEYESILAGDVWLWNRQTHTR